MKIWNLILPLTLLVSCTSDRYQDFIDWSDEIEVGTSIQDVQKSQPAFVGIDWKNPEINQDTRMYYLSGISGYTKGIDSPNWLVFENGKFAGRISQFNKL